MFSKISYSNFIKSINSSVTSISIPDRSFRDVKFTIFDSIQFLNVESIEIGNNCFGSVITFKIDGLNGLKSLKIGSNSYIIKGNINKCDESKSFHILNCESLESIEIGECSFSDYGGEFELKNLPQLQSIQIGTIGSRSLNFHSSSFKNAGNDMILKI